MRGLIRKWLPRISLFALTTFSVGTVGCGEASGPDELPGASFGGVAAKSDGVYTECQLAEVLKFVNESGTTEALLKGAGVGSQAARGILAHRLGLDGLPGSADDDVFDSLQELDDIPFVGPATLGHLVGSIVARCADDLASRPYIDSKTFAGSPGSGWGRDNVEFESVNGVQGMNGQQLRALLVTPDAAGRTLFQRVRKSKLMEGFSYSYGIDEMSWESDRHEVRERSPYVALTIESGRFEPNEEGVRELSLGTDLNDDTYFDTTGNILLTNGAELRTRARFDTPTEARRLLVQVKFDTQVDADGNKSAAKNDVRTDSGASYLKTLDEDVRSGKLSWGGIATPVKALYESLVAKAVLPDIGGHTQVLLLDPKAHLRSTRARYHLNEAYINDVVDVYKEGSRRIQEALDLTAKARTGGLVSASDEAAVAAFEAMAKGIQDKSLIATRAGLDVSDVTLPDAWEQTRPATIAELEKFKKLAEATSAVLHEFADAYDEVDRVITGTTDESLKELPDQYRAWQWSLDKALAKKTVWEPIMTLYKNVTDADRAARIAEFNTYGEAQKTAGNELFEDFAPIGDAGWQWLGLHLQEHAISVGQKQIEAAGTAATLMWFDMARRFYVPSSYRTSSNFIIDTTDLTEMVSHEEWVSIPEADRNFAKPLPADKIFHTTLVNETQIELGSEEAYVNRIKELETKLAATPGDADTSAMLDGARFIFNEYKNALKLVTEVKGDDIVRRLKRAGAPSSIVWGAPPDSKGNIALKILADKK